MIYEGKSFTDSSLQMTKPETAIIELAISEVMKRSCICSAELLILLVLKSKNTHLVIVRLFVAKCGLSITLQGNAAKNVNQISKLLAYDKNCQNARHEWSIYVYVSITQIVTIISRYNTNKTGVCVGGGGGEVHNKFWKWIGFKENH